MQVKRTNSINFGMSQVYVDKQIAKHGKQAYHKAVTAAEEIRKIGSDDVKVKILLGIDAGTFGDLIKIFVYEQKPVSDRLTGFSRRIAEFFNPKSHFLQKSIIIPRTGSEGNNILTEGKELAEKVVDLIEGQQILD